MLVIWLIFFTSMLTSIGYLIPKSKYFIRDFMLSTIDILYIILCFQIYKVCSITQIKGMSSYVPLYHGNGGFKFRQKIFQVKKR